MTLPNYTNGWACGWWWPNGLLDIKTNKPKANTSRVSTGLRWVQLNTVAGEEIVSFVSVEQSGVSVCVSVLSTQMKHKNPNAGASNYGYIGPQNQSTP